MPCVAFRCNNCLHKSAVSHILELGGFVDRHIKKKVSEWRASIGYVAAKESLLLSGFSLSLAQKVLAGTYPDTLKTDKMLTLTKAMGIKWP